MQKYQNAITDPYGNVIAGASVTVLTSTGGAATLYSANGSGQLASNVLTANSQGEFSFYAANGRYTLSVASTGFVSENYTDFVLFDPTDAGITSVKDYGATGDGITDDTAAINLAFLSGAKSICFPAGTYRVSSQLEIYASNINAWSKEQAVIKPINNVASAFGIIRIRGNNTVIDGLIFDGNTVAPPVSGNNNAIQLDTNSGTLTNVDVINCTLQNFKGYGIYSFTSGTLTNVNILNCTFTEFTSTAATPPGAVQLVTPICSDIRIADCYFKNLNSAGVSIRSVSGASPVTNVAIVGCVFEHNTSLYTTIGAEIWEAQNLSVSGCTFKNARMGLSIFGQNIAIAGNTFDNQTSYCIEASSSVGLSVSGNSFSNFNYGLIHYNTARDVVIDGNTFRDAIAGSTSALNLGWGIEQSASSGATNYEQFIVSNNVFKNCSGVRLREPNTNIIEGNVFETTSANNICQLRSGDAAAKRCLYVNNVFRTSVDVGSSSSGLLQFNGSDHLIANNSFISTTVGVNVGSGIANASGAVISNVVITNTYANNFTNAVILNSGSPTITNIEISSTEAVNCTTSVQGTTGVKNFFGPAKSGFGSFADANLTVRGTTAGFVLNSGNLTANRSVTLDGADVTSGTEYTFYRSSGGDFTLDVGGLAVLNRFESCTVWWDGSTWRLKSYYPQSFRTIYQNSRSAAYALVLSDAGKQIFHPSSDNNPRTFTIPANSSVNYPIGTELTFINMINVITISITTDTLIQAGTGATGSRTLAANGWARAVKISSTEWLIDGTGLT